MAEWHCLVGARPEDVWEVLSNRAYYAEWVVGTSTTRPGRGKWPEVGSEIEYTVPLGPWVLSGHTVVRCAEPPHRLELEAKSGRLGSARIALEMRPWGEETLLLVDEHPLRGPGRHLHNSAVDVLIALRHRNMLARLAKLVESSTRRLVKG